MSAHHDERPRTLTLKSVHRMLDGVAPPSMTTVTPDGMPHVAHLSHAEYIDDEHIALTFHRKWAPSDRRRSCSTPRIRVRAGWSRLVTAGILRQEIRTP